MDQMVAPMLFEIDLARDFSAHPYGRYDRHGPVNGSRFRREKLEPPLRAGDDVLVDLDGTSGLSSSFLDEAFAGLVKSGVLTPNQFPKRVRIKSLRDPTYLDDIMEYVNEAKPD
jgi:hypothetical protein